MPDKYENWLSFCAFVDCNLIDFEKFPNIPHEKKVYECYSNEKIRNEILGWMKTYLSRNKLDGKCAAESKRLRDLGNEKYSKADVEGSLKLYTKSIIYAPRGSRELALALGNRSAASFRLRNYQDCIADVDFAMETFEDETVSPKLLSRKQDALKKLEKLDHLKSSPIYLRNDVLKISKEESCNTSAFNLHQNQLPSVSRGTNECFPFASCLIKLELGYANHRRVVANENIEVGEILFVEDPYSFVLLPDHFAGHCQLCSAELKCPIACSGCNDFLFCNQTCFEIAYDLFHKWECNASHLIQDTGVGFLALRTLFKATHDPFSLHYEQVNDLETHLDEVPVDDLISFTLTATMLVLFLENYSNYFTHSSVRKSVDGVGFRILKHIIQIICNAFAAKKSHFNAKLGDDSLETCLTTFSTGLYPSAAMMNHSCDPNIITSFYRNILVVRASQRIKQGEEVFNCYGPHYRREKIEQRKEILKNQFYFECNCKQCNLAEKKETNFLCLKCAAPCTVVDDSGLKLRCTSCDELSKRQQYDELLEKAELMKKNGYKYLNDGNFEKALPIFEKVYNFLLNFLNYSSPEVEICSLDIDSCHMCMGSWHYIDERARRLKTKAGRYSLHYGEFLRHSLSTYLISLSSKMPFRNSLPLTELSNYVDELVEIVQFNFGSWSSELSYVKDLKNSLAKHHKL